MQQEIREKEVRLFLTIFLREINLVKPPVICVIFN